MHRSVSTDAVQKGERSLFTIFSQHLDLNVNVTCTLVLITKFLLITFDTHPNVLVRLLFYKSTHGMCNIPEIRVDVVAVPE